MVAGLARPRRLPRAAAGLLSALLLCGGCSSGDNDGPEPSPPDDGGGNRISGNERIGWDQAAESASDLARLRYVVYVDGARRDIDGVSCATSPGPEGFACSGRLPQMSPGSHILEMATVTDVDGERVESAKSAPLQVTVIGASSPVQDNPLQPGERLTTTDGVMLEASAAAEGHRDITDIAVTRQGWLIVAERTGGIVFYTPAESFNTAVNPVDGQVLAIAPDPNFEQTAYLYVLQSTPSIFRVVRHRLFDRQLIDRAIVLPDIGASAEPAGALRFGPDGKLYAAFDNAGSVDAAARLANWSGKILRVNADGTTPDDQPATSPVMWANLGRPRGLAWSVDGRVMYLAERGADGVERLRAIVSEGRPRRAGLRSSYVLPGPVGASSISMAVSDAIPQFGGNLFVAAREGSYLLRIRFQDDDGSRVLTSEKLLEGRLGELRAVVSAPDGRLYVANQGTVWRLSLARPQ
ncbi:MAG TPA: PQQ-dependent sugar dehydrogenase [Vicinamibacterales bacterium]